MERINDVVPSWLKSAVVANAGPQTSVVKAVLVSRNGPDTCVEVEPSSYGDAQGVVQEKKETRYQNIIKPTFGSIITRNGIV